MRQSFTLFALGAFAFFPMGTAFADGNNNNVVIKKQVMTIKEAEIEKSKANVLKFRKINRAKKSVAEIPGGTILSIENAPIENFGVKIAGKKLSEIISKLKKIQKKDYIWKNRNGMDIQFSKESPVRVKNLSQLKKVVDVATPYKMKILEKADIDADGQYELISFKLEKKNRKSIALSSPMTIKSFFKKLGKLNNRTYIVNGNANIPVSYNIAISDEQELKKFLKQNGAANIKIMDNGRVTRIFVES